MIWDDSIVSAAPSLKILTRHIAAEIRSVGPDFPGSAATPCNDELARSVAEFISRRSPGSAGAGNGVLIPSDYLLILACRTLWAIGREQAARDLLRTKGPELNITESYAAAIFAEGLFSCLREHGAFIRALRPASALWNPNGPYWILNLHTFFSFLDSGLELTIWRGLHAFMKQLAVLWDASGGRGALGLKNSRYVSTAVLGFPARSRQSRRFAAEIIRYCEQDLEMAAGARQWPAIPAVINLDG